MLAFGRKHGNGFSQGDGLRVHNGVFEHLIKHPLAQVVLDHGLEILFDTSAAIVSVDQVTQNLQPGIGPLFHLVDQGVDIPRAFDTVILGFQRDDQTVNGR